MNLFFHISVILFQLFSFQSNISVICSYLILFSMTKIDHASFWAYCDALRFYHLIQNSAFCNTVCRALKHHSFQVWYLFHSRQSRTMRSSFKVSFGYFWIPKLCQMYLLLIAERRLYFSFLLHKYFLFFFEPIETRLNFIYNLFGSIEIFSGADKHVVDLFFFVVEFIGFSEVSFFRVFDNFRWVVFPNLK